MPLEGDYSDVALVAACRFVGNCAPEPAAFEKRAENSPQCHRVVAKPYVLKDFSGALGGRTILQNNSLFFVYVSVYVPGLVLALALFVRLCVFFFRRKSSCASFSEKTDCGKTAHAQHSFRSAAFPQGLARGSAAFGD